MTRAIHQCAIVALAVFLFGAVTVAADAGGQFAIPRFVIGTGGATGLTDDRFGLSGTAGQPFTPGGSGGRFGLTPGFQLPRAFVSTLAKTVYVPATVVTYQGGW